MEALNSIHIQSRARRLQHLLAWQFNKNKNRSILKIEFQILKVFYKLEEIAQGKMYWKNLTILLVLLSVAKIECGRRGSFGKRMSKPSTGSRGGGSGSIKDTTNEPETDPEAKQEDETLPPENAFGAMKCGGVDMKMTEAQAMHMKECANSVGVASHAELTMDKVPCMAKCIFVHKKLVDEQGKPHKENILASFSSSIPENLKEPLRVAMSNCLDAHTSAVDPTDETCKTYTPLAICTHMAYIDVCKP